MSRLIELILEKKRVGIVDTFFGDSGKGKVADFLAQHRLPSGELLFSIVERPNGGVNTGHTINIDGQKVVHHSVPSGAEVPGVHALVGRGVSVEPVMFFDEMADVLTLNSDANVSIDYRAHVTMPWHIFIDNLRGGSKRVGTTGKGVGPTVESKDARDGFVTVEDLYSSFLRDALQAAIDGTTFMPEIYELTERFYQNLKEINKKRAELEKPKPPLRRLTDLLREINLGTGNAFTLDRYFLDDGSVDFERVLEDYSEHGRRLKTHSINTREIVRKAAKYGGRMLFEGAQGAFLDRDDGTYPYVTAGNTTRLGLEKDAGAPINLCIQVTSAYATRVGHGPFPTEIADKDFASKIRVAGNEFGSTTGRPRRIGWYDGVASKYAVENNLRDGEPTILAIMKTDVLEGFEPKLFYTYGVRGEKPAAVVYDTYPEEEVGSVVGRDCKTFGPIEIMRGLKNYENLPKRARKYVEAIEAQVNGRALLIGTGPDRNHMIVR